jgi:putative transposase
MFDCYAYLVMSIKAYRFELRTSAASERALRRYAGSCRWTWNAAIAEQRRRREAGEKFSPCAATCK